MSDAKVEEPSLSPPPPPSPASSPLSTGTRDENVVSDDATSQRGGSDKSRADVNKFDGLSDSIQQNIEALKESAREIEKVNNRFTVHSTMLTSQEEKSLMNKVNHIVNYSAMKNRDSARLVKMLRKEALQAPSRSMPEGEEGESRDFIGERESSCKKITRSFTDELLLYQSSVQDFKNELKERLTRQIQSIKPKTDDDFVDISMRSESRKSALFREIMTLREEDLSEEEARTMKDDISEKYAIVSALSKASSELNKLFLDLRSSNTKERKLSNAAVGAGSEDSTGSQINSSISSTSSHSSDEDPVYGTRDFSNLLGSTSERPTTGSKMTRLLDARSERPRRKANAPESPRTSAHRKRILSFLSQHESASAKIDQVGPPATSSNPSQHQEQLHKEESRKIPESGTQERQPSLSQRPGRARSQRKRRPRWMQLFLLATVAVAALAGLIMMR